MGKGLNWGSGWGTQAKGKRRFNWCVFVSLGHGHGGRVVRGTCVRGSPHHTGVPGHLDWRLTACLWGCWGSRKIWTSKIYNTYSETWSHDFVLKANLKKSNRPGTRFAFGENHSLVSGRVFEWEGFSPNNQRMMHNKDAPPVWAETMRQCWNREASCFA